MKRLFYIIITIGMFSGCILSDPNSSKLNSKDYESKLERIEILKKEIKYFSDFLDAEFELFNVNGFHDHRISLPGASSWDYKFVIRVDSINISKWTTGMQVIEFTNYDDNWTKEIIKQRKQNWETTSEPQFFIRKGEDVTMIIYKNEGVIFKRVTY